MAKYKTLHLWMTIPMVIMQAGIFYDSAVVGVRAVAKAALAITNN